MTEPTPAATDLWQHKPWWCQPWSILLTGLGMVAGSWVLLQRWWIAVPLAVAVLLWWWLFLVLAPAAYRAERQPPQTGAGPLV